MKIRTIYVGIMLFMLLVSMNMTIQNVSATETTYYFNSYNVGESWNQDPAKMVDNVLTNYALASSTQTQLLNGNTCDGTFLGDISKVEIRAYGSWNIMSGDVDLRPVFTGGDGDDHACSFTNVDDWSNWFDITTDTNAPVLWSWSDVDNLDCDVVGNPVLFASVICAKVEIKVTYVFSNDSPIVSNPNPSNNAIIEIYYDDTYGITINPVLSIYCSDNESGVTVYWLSNSSGAWVQFAVNSSIENETAYQGFTNFTSYNMWYYWSVNVTDSYDWVNNTYRFKVAKGDAPESYGIGAGWVLCSMPVNRTVSKFDVRLINATQNYSWQQAVDNGIVLSFVYNWSVSLQNYQEALSFVPYEGYWIYIYDLNYSLWVSTSDISSGSSSIGIILLSFGLLMGVVIKSGYRSKNGN